MIYFIKRYVSRLRLWKALTSLGLNPDYFYEAPGFHIAIELMARNHATAKDGAAALFSMLREELRNEISQNIINTWLATNQIDPIAVKNIHMAILYSIDPNNVNEIQKMLNEKYSQYESNMLNSSNKS